MEKPFQTNESRWKPHGFYVIYTNIILHVKSGKKKKKNSHKKTFFCDVDTKN